MRTATHASPKSAAAPHDRAYWLDLVFGRTLPALIYGVVVVDQFLVLSADIQARDWLGAAYRILATALFTTAALLFVVRLRAISPERRPLRIAGAFVGTFTIMFAGFLPQTPHGPTALAVANLVIGAGLAWALYSILYLRRSFAILPEARRLVSSGPYGIVRHPLYLGEGAASLGVLLPVFGWPQAALLAIIVVAQALRIKWEEEALASAFGSEYQHYRRRVPLLIPFLRRPDR